MKKFLSLLMTAAMLAQSVSVYAAVQPSDKAELGATRNYLLNGGCERGTTGWSAFNTTWSSNIPTTITAGSTKLSMTKVTTNILDGNASCQMNVTTAASSAGHGIISDPMTISDADLAKLLAFQMSYNFVSGASNVDVSGTSTQTLEIWFYNVGLATWYQPAGYRSINTASSVTAVPGQTPAITYQSDISKSGSNNKYRVAIIIKNAPAGTFQMNFDSATFGPQKKAYGPVIVDWAPYTPTFSAGWGTVTGVTGWYKRVGDTLYIKGTFTTGTVAASAARISIPSGLAIDTTKQTAPAQLTGGVAISASATLGATNTATPFVTSGQTTNISFGNVGANSSTNSLSELNGNSVWNSATQYSFAVSQIPIAGWSSSLQLSQDTDTRIVAAKYTGNAGTSITAGSTNLDFSTQVYDTHAAWNGTIFTASVSGFYELQGQINLTSGNSAFHYLYINGVQKEMISMAVGASSLKMFAIQTKLNGGDIASIRSDTNETLLNSSQNHWIAIKRLSGPSVIASNEKIYLQYTGNSGAALTANTTNVDFATKIIDSHSAWSGSVFTAPRSDFYTIEGLISTTTAATRGWQLYINGNASIYLGYDNIAAGTNIYRIKGSKYLNGGDTMSVRSDSSGTESNSASQHWISIWSQ